MEDLPIFKLRENNNRDKEWANVRYEAEGDVMYMDGSDESLSRLNDSIGIMFHPEDNCRPDGILMLGNNKAITVGIAVYSNEVLTEFGTEIDHPVILS